MMQPKLCECGCGDPTPIAPQSRTGLGHVKGQPLRFINGHNSRAPRKADRYRVEDRGYKTPCWVWQLALDRNGYGRVGGSNSSQRRLAHRFYYEQAHGPIPTGLQLDHLCRVPACVNPEHLEPVTNRENTSRGKRGVLQTHCANGHPWVAENIVRNSPGGGRTCRICRKERSRQQSQKRRERREAAS